MNIASKVWFWLLLLGLIMLIAFILSYEFLGQVNQNVTTTPYWVWLLLVVTIFTLLLSLILFFLDDRKSHELTNVTYKDLSCLTQK
jgi:hypothetical protein